METSVIAAVNVSILAMSVIFIMLTLLIFTIQFLVKLIPYKEPPAAPAKQARASTTGTTGHDDEVAAITATLAAHLGKRPDEFRIVNIQSH
ncbi:MAG: OadG family transporter subunit [Nitrospinota bacterium]